MTDVDENVVIQLTSLSRIHTTQDEKTKLIKTLSSILSYAEQLQEVDTDDVPACNHVLENMKNVMREDEPGELLDSKVFLSNASSAVGGMIRVPPVIKF